jgi:hypothetical protein
MDQYGYYIFQYGAPIFGVSMGLLAFPDSVRTLRKSLLARHWPQAAGVVRVSDIVASQAIVPKGSGPRCRASLVYEYEVNRQKFTGTRIFFGNFGTSHRPWLQTILAPYPVNAPVVVFYDPAHPCHSVLRTGLTWFNLLQLGLSAFFIIFAVAWFFAAKQLLPLM